MVDRKATKEAFLDGLRWLKDAMKPQDVGIIFFSGHGHRDDDGIFYMLPAEVKRRSIDATGVDGRCSSASSPGIKGKLVVMLDACHSGAVEKEAGGERQLRPITDDFVRDMVREDSGVIMMCSSTGQEVSIEDPQLGHGFFTQALTEGLSGQADSNKDGLVYVTELDAYLVQPCQGALEQPAAPCDGQARQRCTLRPIQAVTPETDVDLLGDPFRAPMHPVSDLADLSLEFCNLHRDRVK